MKKVILLLLLFPYPAYCQIVDYFETGSISGWTESIPGHWMADSVSAISGISSLHHIFDNQDSGADCIGLPLTNLHPSEGNTKWTFTIKHGCDPSASNSWSLFLMSDHPPLASGNFNEVSGFATGVNLTGYDDTLRLWKIKSGIVSVIASCPVNWQNDVGISGVAEIVVERNAGGLWNLAIYKEGKVLKGTVSGFDPDLFNSSWLVLNYKYTSSRDRLLWFDDLKIDGIFYEDKIPPEITAHRITGENSIELVFSEEVMINSLAPADFHLNNGENTCINVRGRSASAIELVFTGRFINKKVNHLVIDQLCDIPGNCTSALEIEFSPAWPETGDVIISEIMADPLPPVSLPAREYIEITNTTPYSFNMTNWTVSTENQKIQLPSQSVKPDGIIILCSPVDTNLFSKYGEVIGLKPFPALIDEGKLIWLSDSSGNLIHGLEYSSSWYNDKLKEEGGWSLEIIDKTFPFYYEGNWEGSSSKKGGSPGMINSAARSNPDILFYGIENVFPSDSGSVELSLSEPLIGIAGETEKVLINGNPVKSVEAADPLFRRFTINPADPLKKGSEYTLLLPGQITDFAGNNISRASFRFGMAENASKHDILFNELLFNPPPEDPDYIELYNHSGKIIDASRLYLVSISTETGDTSGITALSQEPRIILPGSYYVATLNRSRVIEKYTGSDPEYIFNSPSLPSMPDDKGHLLLLNREMEIIDEVVYSEAMHYSLLADNEGVSLEKVRPDILSAESMNWHSASESSGWGTPGKENSVFSPSQATSDRISFSTGRITPDNDGFGDILIIDLDLEGNDNVVTISIFDETGGFVRNISENFLAGDKASIVWDATASDGSLVKKGIYIILTELYDINGKCKSWKKVCTVLR